jgi:hypothetical protein
MRLSSTAKSPETVLAFGALRTRWECPAWIRVSGCSIYRWGDLMLTFRRLDCEDGRAPISAKRSRTSR